MPYDLMYFRTKATPSMQENQVTLHLFRIVILWSNCEQVLQILKQSPEGFLQSLTQKFTGKYLFQSLFFIKVVVHNTYCKYFIYDQNKMLL